MKRLFILFIFLFIGFLSVAQTANDFGSVYPFTLPFCYGTNNGYYGSQFNNPQLSQLQKLAGCRNLVPYLPAYDVTPYPTTFIADMTGYAAAGFSNNYTAVLGGVYAGNQLDSVFGTSPQVSWVWRNLYKPIWLDSANGIIDTANYFAVYVDTAVYTYHNYISVYTIVNEALYTGCDSCEANWAYEMPQPNQMSNLYCPFTYYERMLQIAWTVIKKKQPSAHISIGGILSATSLGALLRYTANTGAGVGTGTGAAGSVSAAFPLRGGAYFDVMEEHYYPQFDIIGGTINSDNYVSLFQQFNQEINDTLYKYGYNGVSYPIKPIVYDETGALKSSGNGFYGNDTLSYNYQIKCAVMMQYYGAKNGNDYALGDDGNPLDPFNPMGKYGDLTPSSTTISNAPKSNNYWANATVSQLLFNKPVDSLGTAALGLPSNISGSMFKDSNGNKVYVLWAKCTGNQNEVASATYTLPAGNYTRYEWDYSRTNLSSVVSGTVALNGSPSIFFLQPTSPCHP